MRILDLSNQVFGKLTAISSEIILGKRGWRCQCECGNNVFVSTSQLTSGNKKSCGCWRDCESSLIGKKFGNLSVIDIHIDQNMTKKWTCECLCGKICYKTSKNLMRGNPHCGCKSKTNHGRHKRLAYGEAMCNRIISSYVSNARAKGVPFLLSKEEMVSLFSRDCHYCGCSPNRTTLSPRSYGGFTYNGIDRKEPSLGYITENVVSCCTECNFLKNKYSYDEFLNKIRSIARNHPE